MLSSLHSVEKSEKIKKLGLYTNGYLAIYLETLSVYLCKTTDALRNNDIETLPVLLQEATNTFRTRTSENIACGIKSIREDKPDMTFRYAILNETLHNFECLKRPTMSFYQYGLRNHEHGFNYLSEESMIRMESMIGGPLFVLKLRELYKPIIEFTSLFLTLYDDLFNGIDGEYYKNIVRCYNDLKVTVAKLP